MHWWWSDSVSLPVSSVGSDGRSWSFCCSVFLILSQKFGFCLLIIPMNFRNDTDSRWVWIDYVINLWWRWPHSEHKLMCVMVWPWHTDSVSRCMPGYVCFQFWTFVLLDQRYQMILYRRFALYLCVCVCVGLWILYRAQIHCPWYAYYLACGLWIAQQRCIAFPFLWVSWGELGFLPFPKRWSLVMPEIVVVSYMCWISCDLS